MGYFHLTCNSVTRATAWSRWRTPPAADGCDSRGERNKQLELWNRRGSKCQRVVNSARCLHAGKCVRTPHCTHSYGTVWQLCKHQGNAEQNTAWPGTPPPPSPTTTSVGLCQSWKQNMYLSSGFQRLDLTFAISLIPFLLSASNRRWVIKYSYFYC